MAAGLLLTCALALASAFRQDRVNISFLYWSWAPWLISLAVNDFVVAVFAWVIGFVAAVFGMKPRKRHRASGAAYFLVILVISTSSLLLANRFVNLYPLTPERTSLIQFAVLFMSWGFGLIFALPPFLFWVGPMTDDAPVPTTAAILGLGQPIGLVLLFRFLNQNLWLGERSNLFELTALGGSVAIIIGGLMAAVERRGGRLLGYAAVFTLGFALLDLSRTSQEGLAYGGLEVMTRAAGLSVLACAVTCVNEVKNYVARRVAQATALLAGFSLVGLRLGVGLAERWNALLELAGNDQRLFAVMVLAHMGLLIGIIRLTRFWFQRETESTELGIAALDRNGLEATTQPTQLPLVTAETIVPSRDLEIARIEARQSVQPGPAKESLVNAPLLEMANGTVLEGEEKKVGLDSEDGNEPVVRSEEYVFEEHVREIVNTILERTRPYLIRAAHSLPAGTMGMTLLVWNSWRTWASISLMIFLIGVLLAIGLVPGAWFDRAVASLGQPPLVH